MNRRWAYLVSCLLALSFAVLLVLPGSPAHAQSCTADSQCTGVDEACVFDRCVQVRCNSDLDCTQRLPFCLGGKCVDPACSTDTDCSGIFRAACQGGACQKVECLNDSHCGSGRSCVANQCRDCVSNAQCGSNGVCTNNQCICVECTRAGQCGFDQKCSRENRCVDFCEEGRVFASATDGNRVCRTCVNPNTAQRCNTFPGCEGFGASGTICAQGFCIPRCNLEPPDFDQLHDLLDEFTNLRYLPDPNGLPNCPACKAVFELAPVRTALERAGINQPVTLRLLHPSGRVLADLGTIRPNQGSWASVPLRAQPRLQGALGKDGGCGFTIEIHTAAPKAQTVRAPICLRPR
jgi:Cys-rich repeat protein